MLVSIFFWIISHFYVDYFYAPELIQGVSIGYESSRFRLAHIDGGDWQAVQIGKINDEDIEVGVIFRVGGAHIDNNDMPVSYWSELKVSGKSRGFILFRGHERKMCSAPIKKTLPCK